jgi:hypothetical protein
MFAVMLLLNEKAMNFKVNSHEAEILSSFEN